MCISSRKVNDRCISKGVLIKWIKFHWEIVRVNHWSMIKSATYQFISRRVSVRSIMCNEKSRVCATRVESLQRPVCERCGKSVSEHTWSTSRSLVETVPGKPPTLVFIRDGQTSPSTSSVNKKQRSTSIISTNHHPIKTSLGWVLAN